MVTLMNPQDMTTHEYVGLSTDTKPTTDVPNGSTFIEMDQKKLYAYDADGSQWIEQ